MPPQQLPQPPQPQIPVEPEMSDYDDAVIEDTVHCTCCHAPFVLGDNECYVILDPPNKDADQLKLCGECAGRIAAEYRKTELDGSVRPTVVCLCGSTRFVEQFMDAYAKETDAGKIVLTVGRFKPWHGWDAEKKKKLDELHLHKIDLADEVLILDVGGYIGESTARELAYAIEHGKKIRKLSEEI